MIVRHSTDSLVLGEHVGIVCTLIFNVELVGY